MATRFDTSDLPDPENDAGATSHADGAARKKSVRGRNQSALPQIAIDVANRQVARVSAALSEAADLIDDLAGEKSALPPSIKGFAADASDRLRDLAQRADAQDGGKLVLGLQRSAASHPVATMGIGAAIGALLGLALARLGRIDTAAA